MIYLIDDFSIELLPKWRVTESETRTRILFEVLYDPIGWLANEEHKQGNLISVITNENLALEVSKILKREIDIARNKNIIFKQEDDLLIAKQCKNKIYFLSSRIEY